MLDFPEKGFKGGIVAEGAATGLVKELETGEKPFATLCREVREKGLIDGVCETCSRKTAVLGYAKAQGLRIAVEIKGHPSLLF